MVLADLPVSANRDAEKAVVRLRMASGGPLRVVESRCRGIAMPSDVASGGPLGVVESRCRENCRAFEGGLRRASQCHRVGMLGKLPCLRGWHLAGFPVPPSRDAGGAGVRLSAASGGPPSVAESICRGNCRAIECGFWQTPERHAGPLRQGARVRYGGAAGTTSVTGFGTWAIWRSSAGSLSAQRPR